MGNGVQIARLESAKHAAARIDRGLTQNGALNPPDPLGTAGPPRSHAHAQVRRQAVARARGECISRATAGDQQHGGDDGEVPAAHNRKL